MELIHWGTNSQPPLELPVPVPVAAPAWNQTPTAEREAS